MYQLINWRRNSQPSTICWKDVFYFVRIDFGNQGVQVVAYQSATIHAGEICAVVQLQFPPTGLSLNGLGLPGRLSPSRQRAKPISLRKKWVKKTWPLTCPSKIWLNKIATSWLNQTCKPDVGRIHPIHPRTSLKNWCRGMIPPEKKPSCTATFDDQTHPL